MAARGYEPICRSFWYDFAHYGGAGGFLALDDDIPTGFAIMSANVFTIISVLGGNIFVSGSVDGAMTDSLVPASMVAGTTTPFPITVRNYASVAQNFGITLTLPVTQGRLLVCVSAVIIPEP